MCWCVLDMSTCLCYTSDQHGEQKTTYPVKITENFMVAIGMKERAFVVSFVDVWICIEIVERFV